MTRAAMALVLSDASRVSIVYRLAEARTIATTAAPASAFEPELELVNHKREQSAST